jgi:hypothetical protein
MIDPLPTETKAPGNGSLASAQPLNIPVAVEGSCQELRSDFYRFSARKGQHLSVEVVAQRLGSLLDARVRLLDAGGRELRAADDTPGLGVDCALTYRVPKNSDYIVEIRDSTYEGGQKHRYRLRIGEFPFAPLPFLADTIPPGLLEAAAPKTEKTEEHEPNGRPEESQTVTVPMLISGRFAKPRDRDFYSFEVSAGERLVIRGRTRSLGFPCDLFLQLQDTNGNKVADANVAGADEGTITNTFKRAGLYRLLVEELNQQDGPGLGYQLELRRLRPGFSLNTETEAVSAPPGGSFEIGVKPARRDYDGPITLSVVGLDSGFSLTNNLITARTNETKLRVSVPENLRAGDFRQFVIVGRAEAGGEIFEGRASTFPALRRAFPKMPFPPDALDGVIGFGVSSKPR